MYTTSRYLTYLLALLAVVVVFSAWYFVSRHSNSLDTQSDMSSIEKTPENKQLLFSADAFNNPEKLRATFLERVKNKDMSDSTKSALFWILMRFSITGGSISELYEYSHSNPELAFLTNAEKIYPELFSSAREKTFITGSREARVAFTGYLESALNAGYGSLPLYGLGAYEYSDMALGIKLYGDTGTSTEVLTEWQNYYINRAQSFGASTEWLLRTNIAETNTMDSLEDLPFPKEEVILGLSYYAGAQKNLLGLSDPHAKIQSIFPPSELFDIAQDVADDSVPDLIFFANYLEAASYVNANEATEENVHEPLWRSVAYANSAKPWTKYRFAEMVVNSKKYTQGIRLYALRIAKELAELDPNFKNWLKENGWTDADF